MFDSFRDMVYDEHGNAGCANFIERKIRATVKDAVKAGKLTPTGCHTRRPLCNMGYYGSFNRDNVDRDNVTLVDLSATPITRFTEHSIQTADGTEHALDVVICATGF
jgi:cation diffusion facilitator CzcD-associated flavoprotein CzcO